MNPEGIAALVVVCGLGLAFFLGRRAGMQRLALTVAAAEARGGDAAVKAQMGQTVVTIVGQPDSARRNFEDSNVSLGPAWDPDDDELPRIVAAVVDDARHAALNPASDDASDLDHAFGVRGRIARTGLQHSSDGAGVDGPSGGSHDRLGRGPGR